MHIIELLNIKSKVTYSNRAVSKLQILWYKHVHIQAHRLDNKHHALTSILESFAVIKGKYSAFNLYMYTYNGRVRQYTDTLLYM